jgi:MFS family permease
MAAGNLTGALPSGILIQKAGLRHALITCLIAAPVLLGVRALSPAFPLQVTLAFATGLSLSLWAVSISPTIAAITAERVRPLAFSLVFSMGIGVGAVGAFAGSRMPGWFSHLFGHFSSLAPDQLTLIAACLLAAIGLIPAVILRIPHAALPTRPRPLSSSALKRFLPAIAVWGLVTGSFSPFANVFLATHLRLPLHQVGTVFSLSQLFQVVAVLCAPLVFRRLGVAAGIFVTQIATSLCFFTLAFSSHALLACATYITLTAAQYMSEPGIYSLMMSIVPEELRSGASASMALALAASQLIAAATAGWAFTYLGYPRALGGIALIAVLAGVLFKTGLSTERRLLIPPATGVQAD